LVDRDHLPGERDGSVAELRFDAEEREARGRELRAARSSPDGGGVRPAPPSARTMTATALARMVFAAAQLRRAYATKFRAEKP